MATAAPSGLSAGSGSAALLTAQDVVSAKRWLEDTYGQLSDDLGDRTFLDTMKAYGRVFSKGANAVWQFDPDDSSLHVVDKPMAHNFLLESSPIPNRTFLALAWAIFLSYDHGVAQAMSKLDSDALLNVDTLRQCGIRISPPFFDLTTGGLYATIIGGRVFVGETEDFGLEFAIPSTATGHQKLWAARTSANASNITIENYVILVTPHVVSASMRRVFASFVIARAKTTSPEHLNKKVFLPDDIFKIRAMDKYTSKEIESFLIAVQEYLRAGNLLPSSRSSDWKKKFGHHFKNDVDEKFMGDLLHGHARVEEVEFLKRRLGLEITPRHYAVRGNYHATYDSEWPRSQERDQ